MNHPVLEQQIDSILKCLLEHHDKWESKGFNEDRADLIALVSHEVALTRNEAFNEGYAKAIADNKPYEKGYNSGYVAGKRAVENRLNLVTPKPINQL